MTAQNQLPGQVLAVGLPRAGKTTFMAALWHVLQAEDVPGALRLTRLTGDAKYLNSITTAWREYHEVAGTLQQSEELGILMSLTDGVRSGFDLVFPDLAGETFQQQWTDREWSADFDSLASKTTGLLVFVHPCMVEPLEIYEARKFLQLEEEEQKETPEEQADDADSFKQEPATEKKDAASAFWDARDAAGQVQLVDVLQSLLERVGRKLRVSVIIQRGIC
jgi:GTPase SAR1 family protein